jgi:hypothetical protein
MAARPDLIISIDFGMTCEWELQFRQPSKHLINRFLQVLELHTAMWPPAMTLSGISNDGLAE